MSETAGHPLEPLFRALLRPRGAALLVLALLAGLGLSIAGALRLAPNFDIELLFPESDPARGDYDRFKDQFPREDAHALVLIEAPDLFSAAGLRRVDALERDLAALEGVISTDSLVSFQDVVDRDGELTVEVLFPSAREGTPDAAELAHGEERATSDPLFAWRLANPDGRSTTLRVTLEPKRPGDTPARRKQLLKQRRGFLPAARRVLADHEARARAQGVEERLTLTGMPVLRAEYLDLIDGDTAHLFPLAIALVVLLLLVAFPSPGDVLAAVLTLLAAVLAASGAMGALGFPLHPLTNVTPIVVLIISISDSVHIVADYRERLLAGEARPSAVAAAAAESAVPCLLTEVVIAGGFLGLLGADMLMIQQFGVATAVGVLLAWLANVTVLPLALLGCGAAGDALRGLWTRAGAAPAAKLGLGAAGAATGGAGPGPAPRAASRVERGLRRLVGWIEAQVTERPRRVGLVAAAITIVALAAGARVGREYYNFDDLRPGSPILAGLHTATRIHGGVVPLVIFLEPTGELAGQPEPVLDPRLLALMDRIEQRLEQLPEVENAISAASVLRKAHRLLLGDAVARAQPLPATRAGIAQELLLIDDGDLFADTLTVDRRSACVLATMPDTGSTRARAVIAELEQFLAEATRGLPVRATITGNYVIADAVYRSLVGGLFRSLGVAVAVTFLIFCLVLRSWRLALIGLVPNLLPLALTLGVMSLLRIDLKVSTVIVFSITLVVADDDTIQYLARFRRRVEELGAAAHPDPAGQGALDVLRATGAPMLVTTLAISLGFLTLMASGFLGVAHLGLLIGVSLLAAVAADLFLSPLLIRALLSRRSVADAPGGAPGRQGYNGASPEAENG
ncbi:MAG: RND family transporter [Planctomycetota bacterium]